MDTRRRLTFIDFNIAMITSVTTLALTGVVIQSIDTRS